MRPHIGAIGVAPRTNASSSSSTATTNKNSQYFDGAKKGQVNELKQLLKNNLGQKDEKKRREVIKKVIAYMTLGLDVSRLFPQMCLASYTNDLIQKKMIYLYLTNYAESNAELAVMAINTFLKDCDLQQQDPQIRGLALRNLCSLQFQGSIEYMLPAINQGLKDLDPYVRKTAIIGCIQVFYMSPSSIKDTDIIPTLYGLVRDNDPLVIANSIQALEEILASDGGINITSKMIIYLLNRIKEFNEWTQTTVLGLLARYKPKTEEELFDIMNLLDERLKHSCVSIVLGTVKVFMNFTIDKPKIQQTVFEQVKGPLLTLMSSGSINNSYEVQYSVLAHILFIVSQGQNMLFHQDYQFFYCKVDQPSYIKNLKLNILSFIAHETNLGDLLNELGEYVTDVDAELAKQAIRTLGLIAVRVSDAGTPILKQLTTFISMQREYIINTTIIAFQDILRKFPNIYQEINEVIGSAVEYCSESESKAALIWILGEHGEHFEDAPYILENYISSDENQDSVLVKQTLLTSCVKLFFKRPGQLQKILGSLFSTIFTNVNEDIDLRDRAAFFYRALELNPDEIKRMLLEKKDLEKFYQDDLASQEQNTFEFNTLSIIYQKPAAQFIKSAQHFMIIKNKEVVVATKENNEKEEETNVKKIGQDEKSESKQQVDQVGDLIDLNNDPIVIPVSSPGVNNLVDGYGVSYAAENLSPNMNLMDLNFAPQLSNITVEDLVPNYAIQPEEFETQWSTISEGETTKTRLLNAEVIITESNIEELFKYYRIYSVATGEEDGVFRFYFFSKHKKEEMVVFMQLEINTKDKIVTILSKSSNEELTAFFTQYVENFLEQNQII